MLNTSPDFILSKIAVENAKHAAQLRESIDSLGGLYEQKASDFFSRYYRYLETQGIPSDFGVNCYLEMVACMREERMEFIRTGKYSNSSFEEVNRQVYSNPEIMDMHMHGLVLAQFLWYDQYQRFLFFSQNLSKYGSTASKYLEVGGGHGLYINEAVEQLKHIAEFDLVDISKSSIDLARGIINSNKVNYYHQDIFDIDDKKQQYDLVTIGEVIEHLESPADMLNKISRLLSADGICYLTTPVNAPMIDHIYHFGETQEIRDLINNCGLYILEERTAVADNKSVEYAKKYRTPVMYAAFLSKKS